MRRIVLIAFALIFASYIAWDRLEARWLAADIAAIAARGEPTTLDAGLPGPKTPEQREAASLYAQAAEIAYNHELEDNHRAGRLDVDRPGGPELSVDEIRAGYIDRNPALLLLDRASALDFSGFGADQRGNPSFALSLLDSALSALGSVACLRADLASSLRQTDSAIAALAACMRVERTLSYEQYRSDHAQRVLGSLRILLRHCAPSDAQLTALEHGLDAWPDIDPMPRAVLLDRARFIDWANDSHSPGVGPALGRILFHPFIVASARRALARFDWPVEIARRPWAGRWGAVEEQQRQFAVALRGVRSGWLAMWADPFRYTSSGVLFSTRNSAYELAARRVIAVTLAVERYRRAHAEALPATVDVAEDPYSGRPLIYRKEPEAYAIYSVDVNRKDDGGILYGFGAAGLRNYGVQTPRDYGIRVPLR